MTQHRGRIRRGVAICTHLRNLITRVERLERCVQRWEDHHIDQRLIVHIIQRHVMFRILQALAASRAVDVKGSLQAVPVRGSLALEESQHRRLAYERSAECDKRVNWIVRRGESKSRLSGCRMYMKGNLFLVDGSAHTGWE